MSAGPIEDEKFSFPILAKLVCFGLMAVGAVTFGLSWIGGREVAYSGWTIAFWYTLGLALFGAIFIAISHVSGSGWHTTLKRVPEAMMAYFPVAAIVALVLLSSFLFAKPSFYEWAHFEHHGDLHSDLIEGKIAYLNVPFFIIRTVLYFGVWIAAAWALVRLSRKQDVDGDLKHTFNARKISAAFCVLFALTASFAAFDYVMSIEAAWFSTMFGVYQFGGIMSSGFAMLALLLIYLKKSGYLRNAVNENHFHNVGIWLLSSATFWAYVWFSQFMLVWYSNIPEETAHFYARWEGPWFWISFVVNPLLSWVIPFLMLLPRPNKRNMKTLGIAAAICLVGRFVDIWQYVMPRPHLGEDHLPAAHYGLSTIYLAGVTAGMVGLFLFITLKALEKAPLLAKKDPYFEESAHHHL